MIIIMDALAAAWQLVFRKLSLRDIASCCKTCIKLKCAAESYVSHRTKDATEGSERYAVPYENSFSSLPYAEIKYISENVSKTGVTVREAYTSIGAKGCHCFDKPGGGGMNATVSCAVALKTALGLNPCVVKERRFQQEASALSGEQDGICESGDSRNEEGVADSSRRDFKVLHHRIQAGLCIRDWCSCGIDLHNEAAYDEAGLLNALLELQLEHKFLPIKIDSGGTSRSVDQENMLLDCEQVESQGVKGCHKKKCLLYPPPFAAGPPAKKLKVRGTTGPKGRNDFCHTTSTQHQSCAGMQRQNKSLSHETHNKEENLDRQAREIASLVIFECGPACRCSLRCTNRCTQRGLSAKVKVVRHRQKGWCLHAAENIERGAFICQYAGKTCLGEGPIVAASCFAG